MNYRIFKYYVLCLIAILLISGSIRCYSQIDTTYIGKFPSNTSIRTFTAAKFSDLSLRNGEVKSHYSPTGIAAVGAGFLFGWVGLNISYSFDMKSEIHREPSKTLDLQLHTYGRKVVFDALAQYYEGYYSDNIELADIRQHIRTFKTGLSGHYILNNSKYSYGAAFNSNNRQLKSAGSLMLGLGIYYTNINSEDPSLLGPEAAMPRNLQFGPSIGYAYTWVITPKFYVAAGLTVGMNVVADLNFKRFSVYPMFVPRVVMGYNTDRWSLSLKYQSDTSFSYISKTNHITVTSGAAFLTYTWRFTTTNKFINKVSRW